MYFVVRATSGNSGVIILVILFCLFCVFSGIEFTNLWWVGGGGGSFSKCYGFSRGPHCVGTLRLISIKGSGAGVSEFCGDTPELVSLFWVIDRNGRTARDGFDCCKVKIIDL